ncbi:hypothetical protein C0J29_31455 (plasmid) [Mycobacterium paragordonae]|uniref:Uncharacterized protein n=1 Tax=Mycobacterium paragordonae TaxID=1389713 RepID=A0ABQ1CFC0_9MYCO|nr:MULTISPECIES: hypothetical protein [Mycobacterium]AYE99464.1 hypothetical protein C0J29_31455 [Mycobacterium paragordonae]RUP03740.1 MAG: hypothetical protein EKK34_17515 [Mycobacterium sp.]GFG83042.1 hypothetical protein MPRG_63180 [Mycobacterium paragordonae]
MRTKASATAVVLLFGVVLGAAAPQAKAQPPMMDGVYLYADDDGGKGTWTISTTCSPSCVAHVTTAGGGSFDAPLIDGKYVNSRTLPEGLNCPLYVMGDLLLDGGYHPVSVVQWWDPVTLSGEVHFTPYTDVDIPHVPPNCYIVDHHQLFTLTKVG